LPLYIVEPGLWRQPDVSERQLAFLRESLAELTDALADLGQPLVLRTGEAVEVLEDLRRSHRVAALWSHEETGNAWTFARDRAVGAWAREHGIPWHELPQTGVVRRLRNRDGWARRWQRRMRRPILAAPRRLPALPDITCGSLPEAAELGLAPDPCPGRQTGGRRAGEALLASFLDERGRPYQRAMSTPEGGALHCSRLSPHLAWGTLSMREVFQAAEMRRGEIELLPPEERRLWRGSLSSFTGRLHWHCHFMQKLEDEPRLELLNLHPAYDGLRGEDEVRLRAWATGRTGWPFVDACMRSLDATGWLNFRMRAMLAAVAGYHLWLHWRQPGLHLARLFTDYEPGIHWSQMQMQSGTTGINTVRIYNPIKQGEDHDPEGRFIRRWCPELATVPLPWLHRPWSMPVAVQAEAGCRIGRDYPFPIVDQATAAREARERVWAVRRSGAFASTAEAIQEKHGSRRSGVPRPADGKAVARRRAVPQLELDL
jgi:deoxyribodipyrimidine photo-lyase